MFEIVEIVDELKIRRPFRKKTPFKVNKWMPHKHSSCGVFVWSGLVAFCLMDHSQARNYYACKSVSFYSPTRWPSGRAFGFPSRRYALRTRPFTAEKCLGSQRACFMLTLCISLLYEIAYDSASDIKVGFKSYYNIYVYILDFRPGL